MSMTRWFLGMALLPLLCLASLPAQTGAGGETETEQSILRRDEFFRRQRLGADGQLVIGGRLRAQKELESRFRKEPIRTPSDAGIWNWEDLGPGNIGGRTRTLVIHPTKPETMWVGSAQGGIWRTTNGGQWWTPMNDFLPSLAVTSLAIDPTNPLVLYAGTGELVGSNGLGFGYGAEHPGAGIFKSTDGGVAWSQLPSTDSATFHFVGKLAHHPTKANELLAATKTGIWKTTNGGSSWSKLYKPYADFQTQRHSVDVKYSPANDLVIAVGTFDIGSAAGDAFITRDGGTNWTRITSGGPNEPPISPGSCEITFTPSNPDIIYLSVGMYEFQGKGEIWRSNDGGVRWTLWFSPPDDSWPDAWSNALWVSPTDTNLVVFGGFVDLYRCTNAGAATPTFGKISLWWHYTSDNLFRSAHSDQHVIVAHPRYDGVTNNTVFVVNDGGIQKASNIRTVTATAGWTNLAHHLGVTQFFGGAAAPDGSVIIGGAQDIGIVRYLSSSGPEAWRLSSTGDGVFCAVNPNTPSISYVAYPNLDIVKSTNNGVSYVSKANGITDTANASSVFLAPMVMDPNDPNTLVAGGVRIWRTADAAENWGSISLPLAGNPRCTAIDVAPGNSSVIWVGYDNGVVAHTTNGGSVWINHGAPGGNRFVTDIAVNPDVWTEAVVTLGGYDTTTVWLTSNGGASWANRNGVLADRLPAIQVYTVRYHPLQPEWIYVGTDLGVFASEDKGVHWSITPLYQSSEGPGYTEVKELFWQGTTHLIAATHGRGMWRCMPLPVMYVDRAHVGTEDGTEFFPFNTVFEAADAYGPGALVSIKAGTYDDPAFSFTKRGRIRATGGVVRIR